MQRLRLPFQGSLQEQAVEERKCPPCSAAGTGPPSSAGDTSAQCRQSRRVLGQTLVLKALEKHNRSPNNLTRRDLARQQTLRLNGLGIEAVGEDLDVLQALQVL
jgi:hypothetical protein